MSARNNARHVRQRKLNTKQGLRIVREEEVTDIFDDESQRNIPVVETGVEKGEEVEFHLQAVISAANAAAHGAKSEQQSYIPTPDVVEAKGINYNELYPKSFSQPATYIRFSATVEDSTGVAYCMNDDDVRFLSRLNEGTTAQNHSRKDSLGQCSDDTFEEVMSFFEDICARMHPTVFSDETSLISFQEMEQSVDESVSDAARPWLKLIYEHWIMQRRDRPLMPSIKIRVLDQVSEADDADPYVCFRRREVRMTRKTRGRDAQVVEKLKKLRLELEQARNLVGLVVEREKLNKENLEITRKVFDDRRKLKQVKVAKNIVGEKGEDEELLVNQKPVAKQKSKPEASQQRPSTIRIRTTGSSSAPDIDLELLFERQAEAEEHVRNNVEIRKEQHRKWNHHWVDNTWGPLTPPPEHDSDTACVPLISNDVDYPTPPPSIPPLSREVSEAKETDVEMKDASAFEDIAEVPTTDVNRSAELPLSFFMVPGSWPLSEEELENRESNPTCRIRYGRGGRRFLEPRKRRHRRHLNYVLYDSDSDSDIETETRSFDYFAVSERKTFDYRCALNSRAKPDGVGGERPSTAAPGAVHQQTMSGTAG